MAKLYFKIGSDWEEVVKLRSEISKLKQELKSMDGSQSPDAFKALNTQLASSTQKLNTLVFDAAKAGAVMENDFKKGIFSASQSVNDFTQKIISQKAVVKDVEADVKRLGDAYRISIKRNPLAASGKLNEYNSARKTLDEEKAALFGLTQEQANARLSVKKLRDEYALYKDDSTKVISANDDIVGSMKEFILTIAGADAINSFISNVVDVASNFQKMEAVLANSLGSTSKAKETMDMLADFGANTPFQVDKLTAAYVKLANQGFTPTIGQMKKLGDLASSTGKSFDQLAEAIIDAQVGENERLKEFGIRASKDGDRVTYTFKEQETTVQNTASAIREYILSLGDLEGVTGANERISATFAGRLSNIQAELTNQFKKFGEKFGSELSTGISVTASIAENLNKIIPVIGGLVAAYGSYKAAVLAVSAAHKAGALYENIRLIGMMRKELGLATAAQQAFNTASKANIYAALISLIIGVGTAVYMFAKNTNEATDAQKRLSDASVELNTEIGKETKIAKDLFDKLKNAKQGTKEYSDAKKVIVDNYGKYLSGMSSEISTLENQEKAYNAVTEAIKRNVSEKLKEKFVNEGAGDASGRQAEALKMIRESLNKKYASFADALKGEYNPTKESEEAFNAIKELLAKDDMSGAGKLLFKDYGLNFMGEAGKGLEQYKNAANEIKQVFKDADDLFSFKKEGKKVEIQNKEFWEKQKKTAESTLTAISYSQKELLDSTAKDPKKDLYGLGIDKSIVDSYKQAIKLKSEAEKALKVYDYPSNQEKLSDKLRQQQDRYKLLLDKQKLEQIRAEEDLRMQVSEATIKAMDEGSKKTIAQMELSFEKEMQAIDRQKEDALRKKIEDARSAWEANPDNKKKSFDATGIELSNEEKNKYDALYKVQVESLEKDKLHTEALAMREYLKEYGTFQQQKLAIAEEYAEKIKNAQLENEKLSLGKQRDAALTNVDVKAAQQNIDWQSILGDFGFMLRDQIQPTIDNLKKITQSDEFRNSSVEDQQKIYDILSQLEKQSGTLDKDMFKDVARDLELYRNSLNAYNTAQQRELEATNSLIDAKNRLRTAEENDGDVNAAQQAVDKAQEVFNQASESVKVLGEKASENANILSASAEKAKGAIEGLAGGLNKLKSGSLQQAFDGIKNIGGSLGGKIGDMIANIDPTGIIGGVLGLLDALKDGVSSIFVSLQDTVFGAIEGILNDVFSGDIIMKPLENSIKHVGSILDTITFGGFSSWMGLGDSDKNLERDLEYLAQSNQDLKNALDNLSEKMDKASVADANDIYKVQKENLEKQEANIRESMQRSGDASKDGFIFGGEHSSNYRIDKGLSTSEWSRISDVVGKSVSNAGQFFQLSSKEMAKLAEEDTTLYSKIKDLADNGYKDAAQYMDEYITYYKQLEELENAHNEKLTNISFASVRDEFKNALLDMESDAEDFTANFEKMMQNAIVESLMTKKYDPLIQGWYENWAVAMNDGKIDETEQKDLKDKWDGIVNQGITDRDNLWKTMDRESSNSDREASKKGFAAMSQDSADELNGRFTALQIAGEEINNQNIVQSQSLNLLTMKSEDILRVNSEVKDIASDTRDIMAKSYLELVQISENTGVSAKYLKGIKDDISVVKNNTSRL